jgi:hypothetical protein
MGRPPRSAGLQQTAQVHYGRAEEPHQNARTGGPTVSHVSQHPLAPQPAILIPLASIRRDRMPWHTRVVVPASAVERLARAIRATHSVVPITVVAAGPGTHAYVMGLVRILAVESLGHTHIPAHVLEGVDEESLLRMAISDQEAHLPHTTLERGWALERLLRMRREAGRVIPQAETALEVGIDEGDASIMLLAARTIPVERAEELAGTHGVTMQDIAGLGREALRIVCRAPAGQQDRFLGIALEALAAGRNATSAVKTARAAARAEAEAEKAAAEKEAAEKEAAVVEAASAATRWGAVIHRIVNSLRAAADRLGRRLACWVGWFA